jgi:branched-subunit amino acid transport protein
MSYGAAELALLIALLAGVTLVARNFFLVLPKRWQPRGAVAEALRYAPLAALLAITAPEIVRDVPPIVDAAGWAALATDGRAVAAVVLVLVSRLTRRALWGLAAGTLTYLVWLAGVV